MLTLRGLIFIFSFNFIFNTNVSGSGLENVEIVTLVSRGIENELLDLDGLLEDAVGTFDLAGDFDLAKVKSNFFLAGEIRKSNTDLLFLGVFAKSSDSD